MTKGILIYGEVYCSLVKIYIKRFDPSIQILNWYKKLWDEDKK